jgi:hypothetical protein
VIGIELADGKAALASSVRRVKICFCAVVWTPILCVVSHVIPVYNMTHSIGLSVILLLSSLFLTCAMLLSPIILTNLLIMDYALELILILERKYAQKLTGIRSNDLEIAVNLGFVLHEIRLKASSVFSVTLFVIFAHASLFIVFGIFFGTLVTAVFEDGDHRVPIVFGVMSITLFANEFCKTLLLARKGQAIKDALLSSRNTWDKLVYINDDICLDDRVKNKIACLRHYLSFTRYLRPMDAFNLDQSSFLSMCGLLLTYSVVLLQFKLGEQSAQ